MRLWNQAELIYTIRTEKVCRFYYSSFKNAISDVLLVEVADPNAEEGEILEEEDKLRYDLAKLIKFPGFNASLPTDCVDVRLIFWHH